MEIEKIYPLIGPLITIVTTVGSFLIMYGKFSEKNKNNEKRILELENQIYDKEGELFFQTKGGCKDSREKCKNYNKEKSDETDKKIDYIVNKLDKIETSNEKFKEEINQELRKIASFAGAVEQYIKLK